MREDSSSYVKNQHHLHYHDGGTCHGSPTLEFALKSHKKLGEDIDIYEHTDKYSDGKVVKCYVGIRPGYDLGHYKKHWKRKVKLVATLRYGCSVKIL